MSNTAWALAVTAYGVLIVVEAVWAPITRSLFRLCGRRLR